MPLAWEPPRNAKAPLVTQAMPRMVAAVIAGMMRQGMGFPFSDPPPITGKAQIAQLRIDLDQILAFCFLTICYVLRMFCPIVYRQACKLGCGGIPLPLRPLQALGHRQCGAKPSKSGVD
jgi:hypothetical protein